MKLILVRHGETIWNREKKIQGSSDIGLSERGAEQVQKLALSLRDENIEAIVSSPLKRAYETARAIGAFHAVPVHVEDDLKELHTGDLEGLTMPEVSARFPAFLAKWRSDRTSLILPNGESLAELQTRTWQVIERIIGTARNTAVVSHNFALAAILCKLQNLDISSTTRMHLSVASKTLVDIQNGTVVVSSFNDTTHLKEG